jgi:hypothetical protein
MPQHPDPYVRRSVRLLAMVGELHKRGYQRLRIMPYLGPTGHWRCSISPVMLFYRNHGAIQLEPEGGGDAPEVAMIARYTGAAGNHYFDWDDARTDAARLVADKFINRFPLLTANGCSWDYPYAGWYLRLLRIAERGFLPYVLAEYENASFDQLHLHDTRPEESRTSTEEPPVLPVPPPGTLQRDYKD